MYPHTNEWVAAGTWDDDFVYNKRPFACRQNPAPPSPPSPPPPPRQMRVGPFQVFDTPKHWTDAEAHCVSLGGHLASIHNLAENSIVHDLCNGAECWIGFNDAGAEGEWKWSDGSPANFADFPGGVAPWNPGEPNGDPNDTSDYAYMYPQTNNWVRAGTWDDSGNEKVHNFVCRLPSPPPAPPSPPPPPKRMVDGPFRFVETPMEYGAAEAHCVSLGGHLASIHTLDENSRVHSLCMPEPCWIGFNDIANETHWKWTDGSAADFSSFPGSVAPWNPGEPNGKPNEKTDGAYMYPYTNQWVKAGTWDDNAVTELKPFACRLGGGGLPPSGLTPGGGGGAGGVLWTIFILGALGGGAYWWFRRQRRLGKPLMPWKFGDLPRLELPFGRGGTRSRGVVLDRSAAATPAGNFVTEYAPPLTIMGSCQSQPPAATATVAPQPGQTPGSVA